MNPSIRCSNCIYWFNGHEIDYYARKAGYSECRRRAASYTPTQIFSNNLEKMVEINQPVFSHVKEDDWCGEFVMKNGKLTIPFEAIK